MGSAVCSTKRLMFGALVAACIWHVSCRNECLAGESEGAKDPTSDARILKLITKVKDDSPRIRRMAAQALVKIGRPAVEPLKAALQEADGVVKETIAFVLEKIADRPVWPPPQPRCALRRNPKQEYFVYVPRKFDPEKNYWVFVAVHGRDGSGAGAIGFSGFANEADCIVVAPTFAFLHGHPSSGSGRILLNILDEVRSACKVRPKVFLAGMSMGASFVYLFTFENPKLVAGCAVLSLGGGGTPNKEARKVPWLIACGEDDEYFPYAKALAASLKAAKVDYLKTAWFPKVGHTICAEAYSLTKDHYWRSITGLTADERAQTQADLVEAGRLMNDKNYGEAFKLLRKTAGLKQQNLYTEQAVARIEEMKKTGMEKLAEIEEQARTEPAAALAAIEEMRQQFDGTPLTKAIARSHAAIAAKPEVVAARRKAEDAEKAKKLYEVALELLEKDSYSQALAKLKAAAELTGTPYGEKAVQKIKEVEANPAAMQAEADANCRKWLTFAKSYIANRMTTRARRYLEKIINTYPDRPEADEAGKMLKALE